MPQSVDLALLRGWGLPTPGHDKESRGRVLVVGGDSQTVGAVRLAGEAALRAGAGKLQVACAPAGAAALGVALPEALVRGSLDPGAIADLAAEADVVLVGPGLADPERAAALVAALAEKVGGALVLDALGLAGLVGSGAAVLTPNPDELAHALDVPQCSDLGAGAVELAARSGAVVSVGGEQTWTATPDGELWVDDSGNRGLGVSGSGDVRGGVVAGLLARGVEPVRAAVTGSWAHGRAGERCGPLGYLAREVVTQIPAALAELSD